MRRGTAVTLYLDHEVVKLLDKEVSKRAALDKEKGLTGYSVTNRSRLASEIIEDYFISFDDKELTVERISQIVKPVFDKYGIKNADLFGSYARGEQTSESDIDIIINEGPRMGLEFFTMQQELSGLLGKKVDLVSPGTKDDHFLGKIAADRRQIYAS